MKRFTRLSLCFSKKLEREAKGDEEDKRKSLGRPKDQIKPGDSVMVLLDSNHTHEHVLAELR